MGRSATGEKKTVTGLSEFNLTIYHHPVPLSRNLGTLTSWNSLGHSRPVMGLLYLCLLQLQPLQRNIAHSSEINVTQENA